MDRPTRILVAIPNWIGDAVMATPTLRALRELYPTAHIAYLLRPYVADVFDEGRWHDELIAVDGPGPDGRHVGLWSVVGRLRSGPRFDLAVLLTNSFRSALICWLGGVARRVGYDRDLRGWLLTDGLLPWAEKGRYVPNPVIRAYLGLARYLGSRAVCLRPELPLSEADRTAARQLLARTGHHPGQRYIVINPGAAFGAAKIWPAERFAAVADALVGRRDGRRVVVLCGPAETAVGRAIADRLTHPDEVIQFVGQRTRLGAIKAVIAGADLLVTNDSGPRHFAIAFNRPVVTLFGPTDPAWTECWHPRELQLIGRVPCGPCQLRVCPLDHRCMSLLTPGLVLTAVDRLLEQFGHDPPVWHP